MSEGEERAFLQFVIQHHVQATGVHWDLMLEQRGAERLATWQLARPPEPDCAEPIPAVRIFDHRRRYLNYEGAIGGGRGEVRIYERGTFRLLDQRAGRWEFELFGRRLRGRYVLRWVGPGDVDWRLEPVTEEGC